MFLKQILWFQTCYLTIFILRTVIEKFLKSSEILSCKKQTWNSHCFFSWMFLFYRLLYCFNDVLPSFIFRTGFIVSKFPLDPCIILAFSNHPCFTKPWFYTRCQSMNIRQLNKSLCQKKTKTQKRKKIWENRDSYY